MRPSREKIGAHLVVARVTDMAEVADAVSSLRGEEDACEERKNSYLTRVRQAANGRKPLLFASQIDHARKLLEQGERATPKLCICSKCRSECADFLCLPLRLSR
jgi:hypothetical protein